MSGFVAFNRPEAGGVGCQHLICEYDVSFFIQSEFELGVCDDDASGEGIICTSVIECKCLVPEFFRILCAMTREFFFQYFHGLFIGDVFVMIAQVCFCGRCVDRFGKLLRFLKSFRKTDSAYDTGLFVGCPAAACDIASDDALKGKHGELFHFHGFSGVFFGAEEFRHICRIHGEHVVRDQIFGVVEPERGHPGENSTFVCDLIFQNMVKGGDPVCRDHDQTVADVIYFSYFS